MDNVPNSLPPDFDFAQPKSAPASLPADFKFEAVPQTLPADHFKRADASFQIPAVGLQGSETITPLSPAPKSLPSDFNFKPSDVARAIQQSSATAPQNVVPQKSISEVIGGLLPQSAIPVLEWSNKYLVQPFDWLANKGSEMGKRMTEPITPIAPEERARLQSQGVEAYQSPEWAKGVERGVFSTAGGVVADPRNWPFLASGAARLILQRLISGGFAAMQGKGAYDAAKQLYNDWASLTPDKRAELATQGGLSAAMALGAASHAATATGEATAKVPVEKVATAPAVTRADAGFKSAAEDVWPAAEEKAAVTPLQQLTDTIKGKQLSPAPTLTDQASQYVSRTLSSISQIASTAWDSVTNASQKLWTSYSKVPEWTDFKDAVGKYQGSLQYSDWQLKQFADEIRNAVPDKLRREALTNYIQANGDPKTLQDRATASAPEHKAGYEAALNLNDNERVLAANIRQHFDAKLEEAQKVGMLEHGVENYVNQIWERDPDNPAAQKLRAAVSFNGLQPNPSFIKQRVVDSYFDGEQAGFKPRDKDVGALISAYNQSFNTAIASRAFIKQLHEGTASDGRPLVEVSGSGTRLDNNGVPPNDVDAYFIRPKTKPGDASDYKVIDHPALRGWKWVTSDADGHPAFVQGDMLVHPEYASKLQNILGTSAIRNYAVGRALLKGSSAVKGTLLSLSGFHQVQIAVHSLEHTINPFDAPALDLNDATQRSLVDHGLVVSDFHGMSEFAEGVSGTGLVNKLPLLGHALSQYQEYLFRDYIPRIKMAMAQAALDRNIATYGDKLSHDQILDMTARESNAAFGGLNYKLMARNPTLQDTFRLLALAPDFLEARSRFVGQALKPGGREQMRALALGAVGITAGKAIYGQLTGQDQDWSPDHFFAIQSGNREYQLRTIQGDVAHLLTNPRMFASNRLNPATTRPLLEAVTGRDQWGRPRDMHDQLSDYYKSAVPIPLKGLLAGQPQDLAESLTQSLGFQSRRYDARAEATRQLKERRAKLSKQIAASRVAMRSE